MATKLIIGLNDLLTVNPILASEWDYEKNGNLTPQGVTSGSSKKVYWHGICGHNWQATIASRNKGVGCPICARENNRQKISNTALSKHGSLLITNPMLSKEWNPTKNNGLTPNAVTAGSHKIVWWLGKCGHEWQASINSRNNGSGCPLCASKTVVTGINDLETINPQFALEWDYDRNSISINSVTAGSSRLVWWKCEKGHEWQASPKSRSRGDGCPVCSGKKVLPGYNDLATKRPDLMAEWHPIMNNGLTPDAISQNSHVKVWWKCEKGHEWQASPNHRAKGRNCPYCCANPLVLAGENDLATLNPELAKEWNYEKNGDLTPDKITARSSKSVWWKCSLGHEWKTSVEHRSNGSGCPKCAKGKQTSFPEQAIFYYVSQEYPDSQNGYTEIFNNHGMELDIYIPSLNIGIEYDGIAFHNSQIQKDREKRKFDICRAKGIILIRIREDIDDLLNDSCDYIIPVREGLEKAIEQLRQYGVNITNIDIERDRDAIDACYRNTLKDNSLQHKYPQVAAEWDYSKNGTLTPEMFLSRSNRTVWWKCSHGHSWRAKIDARIRGTGCPYCSNNKILKGFNDLASVRTDLMDEWDFAKNTEIDPTTIAPGSGKKAWWKCKEGHSWQAEVSSRNKGHGCPYCAGIKNLPE